MRKTISFAAVALCGWVSAGAAFQPPPDFSGQWTAELSLPAALAAAAPAAPRRGDMGSGWGSPITIVQDARQITVEEALFSRYDLQPALRFVYALDGTETRNAVMAGHATQLRISRAAWAGPVLRITTTYPAVDPDSGKPFATEVTQALSLESPTTLIVEVTRAGALGGEATRTRTVYRKGG